MGVPIVKTTFVGACKKFFGLKQGQTLAQFAEEIRALSAAEVAAFTEMLNGEGYEITAPAARAA